MNKTLIAIHISGQMKGQTDGGAIITKRFDVRFEPQTWKGLKPALQSIVMDSDFPGGGVLLDAALDVQWSTLDTPRMTEYVNRFGGVNPDAKLVADLFGSW